MKKNSKVADVSLEPIHQEDTNIETIAKLAEEQAEAEKIKKEYEEFLKTCGSGVNDAITNTIKEIMEGKKK